MLRAIIGGQTAVYKDTEVIVLVSSHEKKKS